VETRFGGSGNEMATARKKVKYILSCETDEEKQFWMEMLTGGGDTGSRFGSPSSGVAGDSGGNDIADVASSSVRSCVLLSISLLMWCC